MGGVLIKKLIEPGPNEVKSIYKIRDTRGGKDVTYGRDAAGKPNVVDTATLSSGKATTRKEKLTDNSKSKSKLNKRFNKPTGTGLAKRTRATPAGKAARAKSVLDDKSGGESNDKLG
jgi:hypothetical protein